METPSHWVWVAKTLKSLRFSLIGVCSGHRFCSIFHIPGAGHLALYSTFSDTDRNGLWIRWGSSLNTAATHDIVPSGSQAFLHRRGPHRLAFSMARKLDAPPPLIAACFARATLAFSSHSPDSWLCDFPGSCST
jgi:hypothetical protein